MFTFGGWSANLVAFEVHIHLGAEKESQPEKTEVTVRTRKHAISFSIPNLKAPDLTAIRNPVQFWGFAIVLLALILLVYICALAFPSGTAKWVQTDPRQWWGNAVNLIVIAFISAVALSISITWHNMKKPEMPNTKLVITSCIAGIALAFYGHICAPLEAVQFQVYRAAGALIALFHYWGYLRGLYWYYTVDGRLLPRPAYAVPSQPISQSGNNVVRRSS